MAGKTRVLLADDHEVVRHGLRLLVEDLFGFEVVEASTAADAVAWGKDLSIDLVLLDVRLGQPDGLWALDEIRKIRPTVPVVMLSTFSDADFIQRAIDLGANGYVLKEASTSQLREAIDIAITGRGLYLYPAAALAVARRRSAADAAQLSEREHQIVELLAQGHSNEDIGSRLFLSEKTVKSHLSTIFKKLGVTNRTQAVALALREGIVKLERV